MILSCNSCEKKFIVPDAAIGKAGRLVQCSSCGNKWKQFPLVSNENQSKNNVEKPKSIKSPKIENKKTFKKNEIVKKKKIKKKKNTPNLYSPEYLSKKHGINLYSQKSSNTNTSKIKTNVAFGFYNYLILMSVFIIFILQLLFLSKDTIIINFPASEIYLNYLFETIKNIEILLRNFFSI